MTGAPTRNPDTSIRLDRLEDHVDTLLARLAQLSANLDASGQAGLFSAARIAKTTTSGTYPDRNANTFEIIFCDTLSSYTKTAGVQTPTWRDNKTAAQNFGHVVGPTGLYYQNNSRVYVVEANRQYWIIAGENEAWHIDGTLATAITNTTTTVDLNDVAGLDGKKPLTATVYNQYKWNAPINSPAEARWHPVRERWELYQVSC